MTAFQRQNTLEHVYELFDQESFKNRIYKLEISLLQTFDQAPISEPQIGQRIKVSENDILTDMFRLIIQYKWYTEEGGKKREGSNFSSPTRVEHIAYKSGSPMKLTPSPEKKKQKDSP
jgi:hypothetical protein